MHCILINYIIVRMDIIFFEGFILFFCHSWPVKGDDRNVRNIVHIIYIYLYMRKMRWFTLQYEYILFYRTVPYTIHEHYIIINKFLYAAYWGFVVFLNIFRKRKKEHRNAIECYAVAVIFNKSINRHWFSVYTLYALNSLKCDV